MGKEDLELCLLAGYPIDIKIGKIYPLRLKDIVEIGLSKYNEHISLITIDINDLDSDEINIPKGITNYEFILLNCYYQTTFKDKFIEALALFFKENVSLDYEKGLFYVGDIKNGNIIDADVLDIIKNILMKQNYIKKEKKLDYRPANETARKFIEKLKLNKKNAPKKKKEVTLHSIISGIAWKANNINILNIWNMTVYQIYDAVQRLDLIDNYEGHLQGIFAGTIDPKKIDLKNINWTKMLK